MDVKWKRPLAGAIAILFGVGLAFAVAEVGLRLAGHPPWQYLGADPQNPQVFQADAVLG